MLITGVVVYLGTRVFAEIHVQAKALIVIAPLLMLIALRALLSPRAREQRNLTIARYCFGIAVFVAASLSTLLALRDAPIGFDDRQLGLERLAEEAEGDSVAFLGVDRFSGYYLRGTLARAPAGYVPEDISARPEKTLAAGSRRPTSIRSTPASSTSSITRSPPPPPTTRPLRRTSSRCCDRATTCSGSEAARRRAAKVLPGEDSDGPAPIFSPARLRLPRRRAEARRRGGRARRAGGWPSTPSGGPPPRRRPGWRARSAASRRRARRRSRSACRDRGEYELSLQYHSQVPLTVLFDGDEVARAAGLARRHVPERRRPRRLLARGRGRPGRRRQARGHGRGRRARRTRRRPQRPPPRLARQPRGLAGRRSRDRPRSPTPATATSTTTPTQKQGAGG